MNALPFDFNSSYNSFLNELECLVNHPSVFTSPEDVSRLRDHCLETMKKHLPGWQHEVDEKGNLLSINPKIDCSQNILYLTAHLDTVGACPENWALGINPYAANVTDDYIIGRGANDCKAGVAFMIYLAELIGSDKVPPINIGFMFSFREEGNQGKSSTVYTNHFGNLIPLSEGFTAIVSLENTVSIKDDHLELAFYDREPCNMFITVEGHLDEIREILKNLSDWKPVVIAPLEACTPDPSWELRHNQGGHICSVQNTENELHAMIHSGEFDAHQIISGDMAQTSVLKKDIHVLHVEKAVKHKLVLNYRGFKSMDLVHEELKAFNYEETFPFEYAVGSDQSDVVHSSPLKAWMFDMASEDLKIVCSNNPGRSDSSAIWDSLPKDLKYGQVVPVTCGPGNRSHLDGEISRRTHGPNEGFKKVTGHTVLPAMIELVLKFKRQ